MKKVRDKDGDWGVRQKAGINVGAITDKEKFYHYFMIACALRFPGYMRKAMNVGFIPYNTLRALAILLYDHPFTTYIRDKFPTIEKEVEDAAAKKAEKKAAREQKKAEVKAQAQADAGYTTGTLKSRIYNISDIKDALQKLTEFSNDVNVTGGSDTVKTTPRGTRYTEYTITYNEGKPYEYKDKITIKTIGENTKIISGKTFNNLPERQFVGHMKRVLDKMRQDAADAEVDTSNDLDEVPDEYKEEALTESLSELEQLARDITSFISDYDTYGFWDAYGNGDEEFEQAVEDNLDLLQTAPEDIIKEFNEIIEDEKVDADMNGENDYTKRYTATATELVNRIKSICNLTESKETDKLYKAIADTADAIDDLSDNNKDSAKDNLDSAGDNIEDVKDELKESAERTDDLDTGIKDETETIDLYDDFMKKDCFDETDKELIKGIRDDEKDHRRILRDMKAGKKNIHAEESLKESLQSSKSTKINIRESLNKIDWDTDNKYDLRNMYDASILDNSQKRSIAQMIYDEKSPEELYSHIKSFFKR